MSFARASQSRFEAQGLKSANRMRRLSFTIQPRNQAQAWWLTVQSFPRPPDRNTLYSDIRKPIFISSFCASCSTCLRRRRDQIVFGLFWIIWETRSVLSDVSVNKECQTTSRSHLKTSIMLVSSTYKLSGISLISCPRPALCSLVHDYALYFLLQCSLGILVSIMHGINHYTWANKSTSAPKLQLLKVLFQMTQYSSHLVHSVQDVKWESGVLCVVRCVGVFEYVSEAVWVEAGRRKRLQQSLNSDT